MDIEKPIIIGIMKMMSMRDAAWDDVYRIFPNADYIEEF